MREREAAGSSARARLTFFREGPRDDDCRAHDARGLFPPSAPVYTKERHVRAHGGRRRFGKNDVGISGARFTCTLKPILFSECARAHCGFQILYIIRTHTHTHIHMLYVHRGLYFRHKIRLFCTLGRMGRFDDAHRVISLHRSAHNFFFFFR